jgi:hypothetical protein
VSLRNVTITLDEETARWARLEAARQDTSVSKLVGDLLRRSMTEQEGYQTAMASYEGRGPLPLKPRGHPYPPREETHDRAGLR